MTPNIVKIGDRETGLLFGYTCYKLFAVACYIQKPVMFNKNDELTRMGIAQLFESAYHNYCMANKLPIEISFDEISEWVDELYETEEGEKMVVNFYKIFCDSKWMKKFIEESEKKSLIVTMESPISTSLTASS